MAESKYIFTDTQFTSELERLQLIEKISDPASRQIMLATGLTTGWQCLEVGAGAGSIMKWMSSTVGAEGKVTAVDVDTRFVADTSLSNVKVIQGDINQVTLADNCFDLIHARNILIHLADYQTTISKMLSWLKPNGWLVLEEPDFSALKFIAGTLDEHQAFNKVKEAICQMFINRGLDYDLGIKLPSFLQNLGLQQIQINNDVPISSGGSDVAIMMKLSALQLADKYIATGRITTEDIQTYCRFAEDPTNWGIYRAIVRISGQKS
jgi:2-polyprenyl-3-methyl-5-hydroxy-6-metoxy-1,4-benzoquinol methylase